MMFSIFLMLMMSLIFLFLVFWGVYGGFSIFLVEWPFISYKFLFFFNSCIFSLVLLIITLSVLVYSSYYLNGELNFIYYYFVLMIFVGSMFGVVYSNSSFSMLVSWDLLGISSFFLVLFYNNWDSCSGAMNTVLTNRLGDFFLFVFFSGVIFSSWHFLSLGYFYVVSILMLVAAAFTKSAQFPFSGWLPKAMSAPTPVSSLVHSSTLVTAGLILLLSFSELTLRLEVSYIIFFVGIFTMFFSSVSALMEEDMKKVVALSTLSQMGFSLLTIGMGLGFVSLIHLLSHALFKSCLFMQIGVVIHCSLGQQDGRGYSGLGKLPYLIQLQMLVTLFCLTGLIFPSGAVSKDFILEMFFSNNYNVLISFFFFLTVFLTFMYSYRLWKSLFMFFSKSVYYSNNSILMNLLSGALVFFSVVFIWWMSMNLFLIPSMYLYVDFYAPLFFVFLFLFMFSLSMKYLLKEFIYKFGVDFFAKYSTYFLFSYKFMDYFLESGVYKGHNILSTGGVIFMNFMSFMDFGVVMLVIWVVFFIL
uniref:NADH:ubiquinone reductase (H(+)-translocating) n=1 Tax=Ruizia karukerae TaxID=2201929 RepID=A0A343YNA1_9BILA|nr:NADH dehydrogenase subunit 5 [Ruizia karukerae]